MPHWKQCSALLGVGLPEWSSKLPEAALAPQVDLPQPVPSGIPPLEKKRITLALGINVRDSPLINDDLPGED
jgi:hypothetical protein